MPHIHTYHQFKIAISPIRPWEGAEVPREKPYTQGQNTNATPNSSVVGYIFWYLPVCYNGFLLEYFSWKVHHWIIMLQHPCVYMQAVSSELAEELLATFFCPALLWSWQEPHVCMNRNKTYKHAHKGALVMYHHPLLTLSLLGWQIARKSVSQVTLSVQQKHFWQPSHKRQ